jgi:hypothetical protein
MGIIVEPGNRFMIRLDYNLVKDSIDKYKEVEIIKQCKSGLFQVKCLENNSVFSVPKRKLITDKAAYFYLTKSFPIIQVPISKYKD